MSDESKPAVIKAIKDAVMVEDKGQQLYHHAAEKADDVAAKKMFEMLSLNLDHHRVLDGLDHRLFALVAHACPPGVGPPWRPI